MEPYKIMPRNQFPSEDLTKRRVASSHRNPSTATQPRAHQQPRQIPESTILLRHIPRIYPSQSASCSAARCPRPGPLPITLHASVLGCSSCPAHRSLTGTPGTSLPQPTRSSAQRHANPSRCMLVAPFVLHYSSCQFSVADFEELMLSYSFLTPSNSPASNSSCVQLQSQLGVHHPRVFSSA